MSSEPSLAASPELTRGADRDGTAEGAQEPVLDIGTSERYTDLWARVIDSTRPVRAGSRAP